MVESDINPNLSEVFFEPAHYTVMENVGSMEVTVKRAGGNLSTTVYVDYTTEDGSANAGSDYESTCGVYPTRDELDYHNYCQPYQILI